MSEPTKAAMRLAKAVSDAEMNYSTRDPLDTQIAQALDDAGLREAEAGVEKAITVIYTVENRCMAADGPVTPTLKEMTEDELRQIFLALESALTALQGTKDT